MEASTENLITQAIAMLKEEPQGRDNKRAVSHLTDALILIRRIKEKVNG